MYNAQSLNWRLINRHCFDCHRNFRRHYKIWDYWIKFDRWQDRVAKEEAETKKQQLLRRWLPNKSKFFRPIYITPEREEDVLPPKPVDERTREDRGGLGFDGHYRIAMIRYLDKSPSHMKRYHRYQVLLALQYDQRVIPERLLVLGPDLAAAHFVVSRGGSVKFVGDDEWHKMDDKDNYVLPAAKVDGLYVEALDASKTELMYEGFGNLAKYERRTAKKEKEFFKSIIWALSTLKLRHIRFLSLADCEYMTDWCLGRMHQFENSLEFLDLSNCKRLSAKGLSSLACLKKLKYLRLEGLDHVQDLAKVALMLEDKIPGLCIIGLDYKKALESLDKTDRLLAHPNVRQDAKGNIFLKDELGDYYYLKGVVPERPVVDEDNLPLLISKVRKDAPVVPYDVADRVNELSDGKLKHFLSGSPSSGEWTQETERVLKWEVIRKLKNGEFVDPFLYPDSMKEKALEIIEQKTKFEENALNSSPEILMLRGKSS